MPWRGAETKGADKDLRKDQTTRILMVVLGFSFYFSFWNDEQFKPSTEIHSGHRKYMHDSLFRFRSWFRKSNKRFE